MGRVRRPRAKFHHHINQQNKHDQEDDPGDGENKSRKMKDRIRRSGVRLENIGNRILTRRARSAQPRGKEKSKNKEKNPRGSPRNTLPFHAAQIHSHPSSVSPNPCFSTQFSPEFAQDSIFGRLDDREVRLAFQFLGEMLTTSNWPMKLLLGPEKDAG